MSVGAWVCAVVILVWACGRVRAGRAVGVAWRRGPHNTKAFDC